MIETYGHELVEITGQLQGLVGTLAVAIDIDKQLKHSTKKATDVLDLPVLWAHLGKYIGRADALCIRLNLRVARELIQRIQDQWPHLVRQPERLTHDVADLRSRIEDELKSVYFQLVPTSKVGYYDEPFFGPEIETRFKPCVEDLREAGRCFALGRYTGVVLHCMGIVQVGLEALARNLRIRIDIQVDDWNAIITKIEGAIVPKKKKILGAGSPRQKSRWARVEPFYNDVISEVRAMKNAWRNPSFHFRRRDFDETKAKEVLDAVKNFMLNLQRNLSMKTEKP